MNSCLNKFNDTLQKVKLFQTYTDHPSLVRIKDSLNKA